MIKSSTGLLLVCVTLAALSACKKSPDRALPGKAATKKAASGAEKSALENLKEYYDAEGNLAASEETFAGLKLPKGLHLFRSTSSVNVYRTRVPMAKVLRYFGPLLFTGNVDATDRGATYRNAIVQGSKTANPHRVTVSVLEIRDQLVRVSIEPLGMSGEEPPPPEEIRRKLREDRTQLY